MPKLLQLHMSWAETYEEAMQNALTEWPNGGMPFPKQDIRSPEDFAEIAKLVRPENFKNRMLISPDLEEHRAYIQQFIDLGSMRFTCTMSDVIRSRSSKRSANRSCRA